MTLRWMTSFGLAALALAPSSVAAQTVSNWLAPVDGLWGDSSNWSTDPVAPVTVGYEAVIDAVGAPYVVTVGSPVAADRVEIASPDAELLLDGGSLNGTVVAANAGRLMLENGVVSSTRLEGAAGVFARGDYLENVLRNTVLATTLRIDPAHNSVFVELSETLALDGGQIELAGGMELFARGPFAVEGSGVISVDSETYDYAELRLLAPNSEFTVGQGVTLRAGGEGHLYVGEYNWPGGSSDFVNRGVVEAVGGGMTFDTDASFYNDGGVVRVVDGGAITIRAMRGPVGAVEIGTGSTLNLQSGAFTIDQPINVPVDAVLDLARGAWNSQSTVTIDGGELGVRGDRAVTGEWDWRPGSSLVLAGTTPYTRLAEYALIEDTRVDFQSVVPAGEVSLEGDTVDLGALPGEFVLNSARFSNGVVTGMPTGEVLADPFAYLRLTAIDLATPVRVEVGRLELSTVAVQQPLTVAGGIVELNGAWANSGGITVDGGRLELDSMPDSLGVITLDSGVVLLNEIPTTPSELVVNGGTVELASPQATTYTIADLAALPWSPERYAAGRHTTFDLEGAEYDLVTAGPGITLGNPTDGPPSYQLPVIQNGTLVGSPQAGPWRVGGGTLRDVTLQSDVVTESGVTLSGAIVIQGATLTGYFDALGAVDPVFDDVTIEDDVWLGNSYGTLSDIVVRNGLTLNGEAALGTRFLRFEGGDQTLDGAGEIRTDGYRGAAGGGIEAVGGDLTFGPDLTFHSERNGSRITVESGELINNGTIAADIDSYGSQHRDVPEPSITISVGAGLNRQSFRQNGRLQIERDYEVRVDARELDNTGEIELRGAVLNAGSTEVVNSGELRGDGAVITISGGGFQNSGRIVVGDHLLINTNNGAEEGYGHVGLLQLIGDYTEASGAELFLDLAGHNAGLGHDRFVVSGEASLAGLLSVSLLDDYDPLAGQTFEVLTAGAGITGEFAEVLLPELSGGKNWEVEYLSSSVVLRVLGLPGDFDGNGLVEIDDLAQFHSEYGAAGVGLLADGNGDGVVDAADYTVWRDAYAAASSAAPVPEPAAFAALATLVGLLVTRCRQG